MHFYSLSSKPEGVEQSVFNTCGGCRVCRRDFLKLLCSKRIGGTGFLAK